MEIILGIAAGLILLGLLMCYLRTAIISPLLSKIVYYVGIALVIVGLILLLTPVLIWVYDKLLEIVGQHRAIR